MTEKQQPILKGLGDDLGKGRIGREQFMTLLEWMPDAVLITNLAGEVLFVNSIAQKIFGYTSEEIVGQPVEVLVPKASREAHLQKRQQFYVKPRRLMIGMRQRKIMAVTKDAEEIPVEIALTLVDTQTPKPARIMIGPHRLVVATVRDLRQRVYTEKVVRQLDKLATLGYLGSGLAHQINQPLSAIIGPLSEMSRSSSIPERERQIMQMMLDQARSIAKTVDIMRQSVEPTAIPIEQTRISAVLEAARQVVQEHLFERNITLDIDLPQNEPLVFANPEALEQVVLYLLNNASDAIVDGIARESTERGLIRVTLYKCQSDFDVDIVRRSMDWRAEGGDPKWQAYPVVRDAESLDEATDAAAAETNRWYSLRFSDNGRDVDPAQEHILFDPFYSSSAMTGRNLGLGLTVSRGLMRGMGGEIEFGRDEQGKKFFALFLLGV